MYKLSTLALGAALTLAALPAFAQSSGSGTSTTPGVTAPNNATGTGTSTGNSNTQAPPASATPGSTESGSRALRPGQNPDGTPREQSPGKKGQN